MQLLLAFLAACAPSDSAKEDTATETDADTDADSDTDADTDSDTDTDTSADADGDGALPSIDCDDADPAVFPGADELCNGVDDDCDGEIDEGVAATAYEDLDGDGFGDPATGAEYCEPPTSLVADATDCDDTDGAVYPGAPEPDCTDPTDYDCDGDVAYADADGDGVAACEDCDDDDAGAYPGATETCDGVDDDCDGDVDEGVTTTFYGDADADGYGGTRFIEEACDAPAGFVADASDCDDLDASAFPGGIELCNGDDDDCDGTADDAATDATTFYADADADGFGDPSLTTDACDLPAGYAALATDCDDGDAATYPGADEYCDGLDHDCDGAVDEDDSVDAPTWQIDLDDDGYGGSAFSVSACEMPTGFTADASDCDDGDAGVYPGATEYCDDADDDCDGSVDEAGAADEPTWYRDADADGYGLSTSSRAACDAPTGYVADSTDCDDTRSTVSPVGAEVCNDLDDDCDGTADDGATGGSTYYADLDEDGFGDPAGTTVVACDAPAGYRLDDTDCDDDDIAIHPYAWEDPSDGVDNDCDGGADSADTDTRRYGPTGNDQGSSVSLTSASFPFCGTTYTSMYMQSNGRVTFGSNDTDPTETSVDLAGDVTVAGVWDDLRSSGTSSTEWTEYADAVGFYWVDVPEYSGTGTSTFSIVLFDDGRVLLQYGALAMTDGLAGWSCGRGGSTVGSETDFSAAMDAIGAGTWGVGAASESAYYEVFNGDNDLSDRVIRLCGNVDGSTDPCAE